MSDLGPLPSLVPEQLIEAIGSGHLRIQTVQFLHGRILETIGALLEFVLHETRQNGIQCVRQEAKAGSVGIAAKDSVVFLQHQPFEALGVRFSEVEILRRVVGAFRVPVIAEEVPEFVDHGKGGGSIVLPLGEQEWASVGSQICGEAAFQLSF